MNTKTYNSNTLGELLEKAKKLTEELTSASLGSSLYISCQELVEDVEIYSAESFEEFLPGSLITVGKTSYMKIADGSWVCQSGVVLSQAEFFSLFLRTLAQSPIPGVYCPYFGEKEKVKVEEVEETPAEELDSLEELSEKNGEGIPIWRGKEAYMVTSPADLNLVVWSYFEDSKGVNYTRKRTTDDTLLWTLSTYEQDSSLGGATEKVLNNTELFELMVKRFYKYGDTYHCARPLVKSSSFSS
jgi:hypothetical protein|nr:MAG TPA: hypothetical protein [Caudoviricetes sp.]